MKKLKWKPVSIKFGSTSLFIGVSLLVTVVLFGWMLKPDLGSAVNGRLNLSTKYFPNQQVVALDGAWEFYFDQLLSPRDFLSDSKPVIGDLINVPGSWDQKGNRDFPYPTKGVGTYRLQITLPEGLTDPAISIGTIFTAYKFYVNGQLLHEAGVVSQDPSVFKEGIAHTILSLPRDESQIELVIQVANLNYERGGLRESLILGSKAVLESQSDLVLALELLFIGGAALFSGFYLLLYFMQPQNKTALLFSLLCFVTALRGSIWGEEPLLSFLPHMTYQDLAFLNYATGYQLIPLILLFVMSLYPQDFNRKVALTMLAPTLFFEVLLFTSTPFMSRFTNYLYLLLLLQLAYCIYILHRAVIKKRINSRLMFLAMCFYFLTVNQDILHFKGIGGFNLAYGFLVGNLALIIAMSFVQASQQAHAYQRLQRYNEDLVEADRLKDKILATELSFLQAQIKPHFLYNALSAIANVCEKDGRQGSQLIVDLSIYLRSSLEFTNIDKQVSVEKALELVETYFHIEQARFGPKIQLVIEKDLSLRAQIPALIIQPLVENAVQHGISKKSGGGTVTIRIHQIDPGLAIDIEDNGIGMSPEKVESILNENRSETGIGLINIHHRLLRLYGTGLTVQSILGQGTKIGILIPEGGRKV